MSEVWFGQIALWIWAGGEAADLEPIKAAKAALAIEEKVVPKAVTSHQPPSGDRVLAIDSPPPWIVDYYLVSSHASPSEWQAALAWSLGLTVDWEATLVVDILRAQFGREVREILPGELEGERKLAAYIDRED